MEPIEELLGMIRRAPRAEATGWPADGRLSFTARGLLGFILAQPDNFRVGREELVAAGPDGQYVVRRALKELTEAGYISRERVREANGTFTTDTVVYEEPTRDFQPPLVDYPPPADQPVEAFNRSIDVNNSIKSGECAKSIVDDWWQTQSPRPSQPYMAIVGVVKRSLTAGWPPEELRKALDEVPTVSGATLDFWRNRDRTKRKTPTERSHENMLRYLARSNAEDRGDGSAGAVPGELGARRAE